MKQNDRFCILLSEDSIVKLKQIREKLPEEQEDITDYKIIEKALSYYYEFLKVYTFRT